MMRVLCVAVGVAAPGCHSAVSFQVPESRFVRLPE